LLVNALEQLPISHTFGVPGVHNTEFANPEKQVIGIVGDGAFY